jgi:hypothetical protein
MQRPLVHSRRTWCAAVAAVGLGVSEVAAAPNALSLAELTKRAMAVLAVRPVALHAAWRHVFGASRIVTTFSVEVEETLLGKVSRKRLEIRELGGRVGKLVQRVSHAATLTLEQRSLVFLCRVPGDAAHWVLGMEQGAYRLVPSAEELRVAVSTEQRPLLEERDSAASALDGHTLAQVREEIRRLVSC